MKKMEICIIALSNDNTAMVTLPTSNDAIKNVINTLRAEEFIIEVVASDINLNVNQFTNIYELNTIITEFNKLENYDITIFDYLVSVQGYKGAEALQAIKQECVSYMPIAHDLLNSSNISDDEKIGYTLADELGLTDEQRVMYLNVNQLAYDMYLNDECQNFIGNIDDMHQYEVLECMEAFINCEPENFINSTNDYFDYNQYGFDSSLNGIDLHDDILILSAEMPDMEEKELTVNDDRFWDLNHPDVYSIKAVRPPYVEESINMEIVYNKEALIKEVGNGKIEKIDITIWNSNGELYLDVFAHVENSNGVMTYISVSMSNYVKSNIGNESRMIELAKTELEKYKKWNYEIVSSGVIRL